MSKRKQPEINLTKIADEFFKDKITSPNLFFISYGPPGSGKSKMMTQVLKNFRIPKNRCVFLLVDDIVEKIPGYLEKSQDIVERHKDEQELQNNLSKLYMTYRDKYGDILSDSILDRSLVEKYHVVWETTGHSIDWALKTIDRVRRSGYSVILVYPFVGGANLLKRVEHRAKSGSNPRQPSKKRVLDNVQTAQQNFETISNYVDVAMIFDNNGKPKDFSKVFEKKSKYQGFCKKSDSDCENGKVDEYKCDTKKLKSLQKHMTSTHKIYLDKHCKFS